MAALREDVVRITFEVDNDPLSAVSSARASSARSTSASVLKCEKLNLTAPWDTVPSASCISGAQCAPGRVAIP